MANKMNLYRGAGINADILIIEVVDERGKRIFSTPKLYYGRDISWHIAFATEEKPLDEELIEEYAQKYDVPSENIVRLESKNLTFM